MVYVLDCRLLHRTHYFLRRTFVLKMLLIIWPTYHFASLIKLAITPGFDERIQKLANCPYLGMVDPNCFWQ